MQEREKQAADFANFKGEKERNVFGKGLVKVEQEVTISRQESFGVKGYKTA